MNLDKIWENEKSLIPAIIQDANNKNILMLGYMNKESYLKTIEIKKVTFFSRSRQCLWTKGETSGNFLDYISSEIDCDNDTLLVLAENNGPTCHLGPNSCFEDSPSSFNEIDKLEEMIDLRFKEADLSSYTYQLFKGGIKEMAKKVTEEAGEVSIAAVTNDGRVIDETADLIYHLLVTLRKLNLSFSDVLDELNVRSK